MQFTFGFKQSKLLLVTGFFLGAGSAMAAGPSPTPVPTPTPKPIISWETDIQPIVTNNCSYCHSGVDASAGLELETEAQVLKANQAIVAVVTVGSMPIGDDAFATSADGIKLVEWLKAQVTPTPTPTPVPAVTFDKDIKPIIADNCQGCHTKGNAGGRVVLDTEADVVKFRKAISSTVISGSMPRGDKTFKASPEAKVLLDWIKSLDAKPTI